MPKMAEEDKSQSSDPNFFILIDPGILIKRLDSPTEAQQVSDIFDSYKKNMGYDLLVINRDCPSFLDQLKKNEEKNIPVLIRTVDGTNISFSMHGKKDGVWSDHPLSAEYTEFLNRYFPTEREYFYIDRYEFTPFIKQIIKDHHENIGPFYYDEVNNPQIAYAFIGIKTATHRCDEIALANLQALIANIENRGKKP